MDKLASRNHTADDRTIVEPCCELLGQGPLHPLLMWHERVQGLVSGVREVVTRNDMQRIAQQ